MSKKAVLRFSTLEYLYQDTYGTMPDYDFDRLMEQGYGTADAARIRQERMNAVWEEMVYGHEHENDFRPVMACDGCPF